MEKNKINSFFKKKKNNITNLKFKNIVNKSKIFKNKANKSNNHICINTKTNNSFENPLKLNFGSTSVKNKSIHSGITNFFQSNKSNIVINDNYNSKYMHIKNNININLNNIEISKIKPNFHNLTNTKNINKIHSYATNDHNSMDKTIKSNTSKGSLFNDLEYNNTNYYNLIIKKVNEIKKNNNKLVDNFKKNLNDNRKTIVKNISRNFSKNWYQTWDKFLLKSDIKNRDLLLNEIFKFDNIFNRYLLFEIKTIISNRISDIFVDLKNNIIHCDIDFFKDKNIINLKNQWDYEIELNKTQNKDFNKFLNLCYKDMSELKFNLKNNMNINLENHKTEFIITLSNDNNWENILKNSVFHLKNKLKELNKIKISSINLRTHHLKSRITNLEKIYKNLMFK